MFASLEWWILSMCKVCRRLTMSFLDSQICSHEWIRHYWLFIVCRKKKITRCLERQILWVCRLNCRKSMAATMIELDKGVTKRQYASGHCQQSQHVLQSNKWSCYQPNPVGTYGNIETGESISYQRWSSSFTPRYLLLRPISQRAIQSSTARQAPSSSSEASPRWKVAVRWRRYRDTCRIG